MLYTPAVWAEQEREKDDWNLGVRSQKVQRRQEVRACTEQQSMDPNMVLPLSI
jgi:hypothetical protein